MWVIARDGAGLLLVKKRDEAAILLKTLDSTLEERGEERRRVEEESRDLEGHNRELEAKRKTLLDGQKRLSALLEVVSLKERKSRQQALEREREFQQAVRKAEQEVTGLSGRRDYLERRITEMGSLAEDLLRRETIERQALVDAESIFANFERQLSGYRDSTDSQERSNTRRGLQLRISSLDAKLSECERSQKRLAQEAAAMSARIEELHKTKDMVSSDLNERRVTVERGDVELGLLTEDYLRLSGEQLATFTLSSAQDYVRKIGAEGLGPELKQFIDHREDESQKIRRRLEREGEVDADSIERYETESKRLDDLQKQIEELTQAATTISRTIAQLRDFSKARFIETFKFVSEKFAELVPRLFGGGAGRMELGDPQNPLGSGIELFVRPPGKQPKSLDLLSGGEKALAATAVLIAVFLHHPSPVCVMDEVDAPLDDANLGRFVDVIREISHGTQFMIITHNKQTMISVDRLIGITMQEKGVSTALEVNLAEAEEEIYRWTANA